MAEHSECDPVSFIDVGCWLLFVRLLCIKFLCIRLLCIKFLCIRLLFVILLFFSCLKKFEAWQSEAEHSRLEILSYAASCLAGSWKYLLMTHFSFCWMYFCWFFISMFSVFSPSFFQSPWFVQCYFWMPCFFTACYVLFFSLCVLACLSWWRRGSSNLCPTRLAQLAELFRSEFDPE